MVARKAALVSKKRCLDCWCRRPIPTVVRDLRSAGGELTCTQMVPRDGMAPGRLPSSCGSCIRHTGCPAARGKLNANEGTRGNAHRCELRSTGQFRRTKLPRLDALRSRFGGGLEGSCHEASCAGIAQPIANDCAEAATCPTRNNFEG